MIDHRIDYIKSIGFVLDNSNEVWDRYVLHIGNKTTYIGHNKLYDLFLTDGFKMNMGKFRSIFKNDSSYNKYLLFKRKIIIDEIISR